MDTGMNTGGTGSLVLADALAAVGRGLVLLVGNASRDTGSEGQDGNRGGSEVHVD
jgi:hypothetical protein